MNRIDRLFAILLKLQANRRLQAADLATEFGISKRTVYRDIAALGEMGVPIVSLPGEGYELMPGYYLPALVFSRDEAAALVLGAHLLAEHTTGRLPAAVQSATEKLRAALPRRTLQEVDALRQVTTFRGPDARFDLDDPLLAAVSRAIREQRVMRIRYHSFTGDETTQREIEPLGLHYADGAWYVSAFCRLRRDARSFRFNRIDAWQLLDEHFVAAQPDTPDEPPTLDVAVRFAPTAVRWVRERPHYSLIRSEETADGTVFHFRVHRSDELRGWLLSWGATAEVLSPPALRAALHAEAALLAEKYA